MSSKSTQFDGKAIIVTGSSSGIGAAAAIMFAERGGNVTIHGRREDKLMEVAEKIEQVSGKKPVSIIGDIEISEVRERLVRETMETFGRVDVLVNNAGHATFSGWASDLSELKKMIDVHVIAPMDLSQRVMPELIKNEGNIVMISSAAGLEGLPTAVHYSIAKGGMEQMMRSLSGELETLGVRVNSVCPGAIKTDIGRSVGYEKIKALQKDEPTQSPHPNFRMGEPEEVAEHICFLACDDASVVTGMSSTVDYGLASAAMWQ